jgi:hypothetical protein
MRCHRKRKRRHFFRDEDFCFRDEDFCFRDEDCCRRRKKHRRHHRRHHRCDRDGARATVNNKASTGPQSAGVANVNVQIPINLGDATAVNRSCKNSLSNTL